MRILQLDLGSQRIEFHPYVTLLRGLDNGLREQFIDAVAAIAEGHPSSRGLVEAHGVVLDLTPDTLDLLEIGSRGDGAVDVIVRRTQLPGMAASQPTSRAQLERGRAEAISRLARAEADVEAARVALAATEEAFTSPGSASADESGGEQAPFDAPRVELERLAERRRDLETALDAARQAHQAAQEAQSVAEHRVEQARILRNESARACSLAAGALEAARGARDPFAAAALDAARERLATLEAAHDDAAPSAPSFVDEFEDPAGEIERLENQRLELEASLLALDTVDPYAVEVALAQVLAIDADGELVPSTEAMQLADEIAAVERGLASTNPGNAASGTAVADARRRLEAARAAVFEAERDTRLPEVDRSDIEALENAHEQVLLAQDRLDKRLAGGRAKQRLEEARAAEQEILEKLGFVTYAEFVMGTSIQNVDPEREHRLDAARTELATAEDELAQVEAGVDAELARAALLARRRELREQAVLMLDRDPGDDLEWALRHHRVRVRDVGDRALRLKVALESAGMVLGEDTPPALLIELGRIWLDEQGETAARRAELERQLGEVDARLLIVHEAARIKADATSDRDDDPSVARAARRESQLEEARSAVRTAEQRLERQAQIESDIAARKAELETATRSEEAVAAALVEAEREASEAARAEQAAAAERARCENEVAEAAAAEQRAAATLDQLSGRLTEAAQSSDQSALERAVADAQSVLDDAMAAAAVAREELERIDGHLATGEPGEDTISVTAPASASVEELEWYLLSRVAAQRSVSFAGSVPLVLDDALAGVHGSDLTHLLGRLERMSSAVQVILVSDDEELASWVESVGTDRAMALYPTPA